VVTGAVPLRGERYREREGRGGKERERAREREFPEVLCENRRGGTQLSLKKWWRWTLYSKRGRSREEGLGEVLLKETH
jgi:hypothetical protein